ncbi:MAG: phospholipase D-like domain-containing protein [Pseudomonadota bacterium]
MRKSAAGISVHAIAGSHTVLFGMDATEEARQGLLGFALGRRQSSNTIAWMNGFKFFRETLPDPEPGMLKSTLEHPIQDYQWADYKASPGKTYDYVVRPLYGTPDNLKPGTDIELTVQTGNAEGSRQALHFNLGAVPGQAFARRFGNTYPTEEEQNDPTNPKVKWLSRGLLEATLDFIGRAGPGQELRVAAYEFTYFPILRALKDAANRGAQVRICFKSGDHRKDGDVYMDGQSLRNWDAVIQDELRLQSMSRKGLTLHMRTKWSGIPHNKFMVLLDQDRPVAIWTGSTNITPSGFLGQSNLAHIVEDEALASAYNQYWEFLAKDPEVGRFREFNTQTWPTPDELRPGVHPIFSPRETGMWEWYGAEMAAAEQAGFLTAAFGVRGPVSKAFHEGNNTLRFMLAENGGNHATIKAAMALVEADPDNIVAYGNLLARRTVTAGLEGNQLDNWFLREQRHRKEGHVFYIHTKMMMIDPLSDRARIFSGSANFSEPSVTRNDENMLLFAGDWAREIAPIMLTEYNRLHRHLYFRTVALRNAGRDPRPAAFLESDDSWQVSHFTEGREKFRKRKLFS